MKHEPTQMVDFDAPNEEEQLTAQRRLFTYSKQAITAAVAVDRIMVNYPAFAESVHGVDRVFQLGRELSIQQGIQITGLSGSGKTALARYFLSSQPKSTLFEEGFGALAIRLPSRPAVGQVIGALLRRLRHPFPSITAQTLDIKRQMLIDALRQKGTRLIFIDEAHSLLAQTRAHGRSSIMFGNVTDLLRELMDEAGVAMVLLGTEALIELDSADAHLANRISARFELKGLELPAIWHGFVRSFIKQVKALDLTMLSDKDEARRLFSVTEGNLRSFKRLIAEAALVAVDDRADVIESKHLHIAFERVNGKDFPKENPYAV